MKDEQRIVPWEMSPQEIEESEAETAKILEDMRAGRIAAATPSPILGAHRFHQWAVSQLPENIRKDLQDHLVFPAHDRLAETFFFTSLRRFREWEPTGSLACSRGCRCSIASMADCLIGRFHAVFERIRDEPERIADWYIGLPAADATNVRAFFRVKAPTDPVIRRGFEAVLCRELSQRERVAVQKVQLKDKRTRRSVSLRDAFMLTAMAAVHGWLDIELVHQPDSDDMSDCAGRVGRVFGIKAKTVRNRWNRLSTRACIPEDWTTDEHRYWRWVRIGEEVRLPPEIEALRRGSLERLSRIKRHD